MLNFIATNFIIIKKTTYFYMYKKTVVLDRVFSCIPVLISILYSISHTISISMNQYTKTNLLYVKTYLETNLILIFSS